jgi:hypothetical protein
VTVSAEDVLQHDLLEGLVQSWPGPFHVRALEYGTVEERLAALKVLRADGLAEPGDGPMGSATAAARRAVRILDW